MEKNLQILLATYNGEKYIDELLSSLVKQTYTDWIILAHDDGSSDNTVEKLKEFKLLYPDKITIINDGVKFGDAMKNFRHLLNLCTADYVAFCDQDDVWLPEKLQASIDLIKSYEKKHGVNTPLCVFTDLSVTDESLNIIHHSLFKANGSSIADFSNINNLAFSNCIPGCSMLINKKAIQVSMPMSDQAMMHDWWVALSVQHNGGAIHMLNQPLILYRQHSNNTLGFKKGGFISAFLKVFCWSKYINELNKVYCSNNIFINKRKFVFFVKYGVYAGVFLRVRRFSGRFKTNI